MIWTISYALKLRGEFWARGLFWAGTFPESLSSTGMITADSSDISTIVTTIETRHTNVFTDSRVATLSFFNFWNIHTVALKYSALVPEDSYRRNEKRCFTFQNSTWGWNNRFIASADLEFACPRPKSSRLRWAETLTQKLTF